MYKLPVKNISSDALVEKFVLRLPLGMRAKIHHAANRGRRSMNKEMIARLEHSLANFETVPCEVSELAVSHNNIVELDSDGSVTSIETIDSTADNDKAYAEVLLNNKLRQKIAELSYERKRALLKFL